MKIIDQAAIFLQKNVLKNAIRPNWQLFANPSPLNPVVKSTAANGTKEIFHYYCFFNAATCEKEKKGTNNKKNSIFLF